LILLQIFGLIFFRVAWVRYRHTLSRRYTIDKSSELDQHNLEILAKAYRHPWEVALNDMDDFYGNYVKRKVSQALFSKVEDIGLRFSNLRKADIEGAENIEEERGEGPWAINE